MRGDAGGGRAVLSSCSERSTSPSTFLRLPHLHFLGKAQIVRLNPSSGLGCLPAQGPLAKSRPGRPPSPRLRPEGTKMACLTPRPASRPQCPQLPSASSSPPRSGRGRTRRAVWPLSLVQRGGAAAAQSPGKCGLPGPRAALPAGTQLDVEGRVRPVAARPPPWLCNLNRLLSLSGPLLPLGEDDQPCRALRMRSDS